MVDKHGLYRHDRPHSAVVHVLKNVIHPAADIAQIRPLQRGNDARRVGMAAQADLIELAEQLRRGYRKLRLADDENAEDTAFEESEEVETEELSEDEGESTDETDNGEDA